MKKLLALVLTAAMAVTIFSGCTQRQTLEIKKDGKCSIEIFASAPAKDVDDLLFLGLNEQEKQAAKQEMLADSENEMQIKNIDGEECYVIEIKEKFSSIKKLVKYVTEGDGAGVFSKFDLTTKNFEAIVFEDAASDEFGDYADMYEDMDVEMENIFTITMPYKVNRTNGKLADDGKTVTFDLQKQKKIYASYYAIAFKKNYLKSNSSAFISWNKVKGAKKYKLEYKVSGTNKWKSTTTTKTEKTVKSLKAGKKYTFKVTAITADKNYTSNNVSLYTLKKSTSKVKTKTAKSVKLSWNKNSNGDGYIVYRKTASGKWKSVKTIKNASTTSYTVKGLKSGTKYSFKVAAYSTQNGKKVLSPTKAVSTKTK